MSKRKANQDSRNLPPSKKVHNCIDLTEEEEDFDDDVVEIPPPTDSTFNRLSSPSHSQVPVLIDSNESDDDLLSEDPLESYFHSRQLESEELEEIVEMIPDRDSSDTNEDISPHLQYAEMFSEDTIRKMMKIIKNPNNEVKLGAIEYHGQGKSCYMLMYTEKDIFPLAASLSFYFTWLPVSKLKAYGFNTWYRRKMEKFKQKHSIPSNKTSFVSPAIEYYKDIFESNLKDILHEQLRKPIPRSTSSDEDDDDELDLVIPNANFVEEISQTTEIDCYVRFCIDFPLASHNYDFLKSNSTIELDTGAKYSITKAKDTGKRLRMNTRGIIFQAELVQNYLKAHPEADFELTVYGLISLTTWRKLYPFIDCVTSRWKRIYPQLVAAEEQSICTKFDVYYVNIASFLTYMLFKVKNSLVKADDYFNLFLNANELEFYYEALTDKDQFGYDSPNTCRRKLEPIQDTLKFLVSVDLPSRSISIMGNIHATRDSFNLIYKRTNVEREYWLLKTHTVTFLSKYNQYISAENFYALNMNVYHILICWVHMYYDRNLPREEKDRIIRKHGWQYQLLFSYWLIIYTYANRSQYYYQSSIAGLRLYKFDNGAQYYYLIFNNENNRLKSRRSTDESSFPLGECNNLLIHFYKHVLLPKLLDNSPTALFYSVRGNPVTVFNSKGKGVTTILKQVTKAFTGVGIGNQKFRLHYNTHLKAMDNLTEEEKLMIDRGMNHSKVTADKHYLILSTSILRNSNPSIDRSLMTQSTMASEDKRRKEELLHLLHHSRLDTQSYESLILQLKRLQLR